jgi:glycosyltransferase involved in cell wall biosynthesis
MKIIYCIHSIYNPGGMERVLLNKVKYLVEKKGWEIMIVTTDQHSRPPFYPFPDGIRMIDLDVNYSEDNDKNVFAKIFGYLRRRRLHKARLTEVLCREKADFVVSLYPSESSFIPSIKDGSKKILELHFCKFFRLQYMRGGLIGLIDRFRTWLDERIVKKFDKFVVLTEEDKENWGELENIEVIPNASLAMFDKCSDLSAKRVIAVGRLDYQKGFDRLVKAWEIVWNTGQFNDWRLDIFGQGEWHDMLQDMIDERGLTDCLKLNRPTNDIGKEYAESSLIVMTSNYEGFGMVLVEAMSCGVPAVAFDCQCGPRDIVRHGERGLVVKNGDIDGLAEAMMTLMKDDELRKRMGEEAKKVVETFSEAKVMDKWVRLYEETIAD